MLIRNPKAFMRGCLLMGSFVVVFVIFFLEVFPGFGNREKVNGLDYADNLFNTLSKGSSNFFDKTATHSDSVEYRIKDIKGKVIDIEVPFKENQVELIPLAEKLVKSAGLEAMATPSTLKVKGDLHTMLLAMVDDSLSMYNNNDTEVATRHNEASGKLVMKAWWQLGTNMVKPLQKIDQVDEASAVNGVISKAIEPSYNFYGIIPLKVKDNIPLVAGFLIFYVVYTMWYGFAIFELFEGIGLTMKKSVKQEV